MEEGDICQEETKENIRKEYFEKLRAILKSKVNTKYAFQATNIWVVPTVQNSAGIVE